MRTTRAPRCRPVWIGTLSLLAACGPVVDDSRPVIGFAQVASSSPLDEARDGFFRALADSGFVPDSTITVVERNAQGDIATLMLIMNEFKLGGIDYVATVSSVATQAAMRAISDRPIIFGAVMNRSIMSRTRLRKF